jgi:hypothetical protein
VDTSKSVDTSKTLLASIAVVLAVILAPSAAPAGAAVVPPGNSAANQYTETLPTTGGNTEAKKGKHKVTPAEAIGSGPAKKLDTQGKQGHEAAAVIAATSPPPVSGAVSEGGNEGSGSVSGAAGGGNGGSGHGGGSEGAGKGQGAGGEDSTGAPGGAAHNVKVDSTVEEPGGSSGFGEVLGQATGSTSSGGTGLLLPLAILAIAIWAVVFLLRRRRRTA